MARGPRLATAEGEEVEEGTPWRKILRAVDVLADAPAVEGDERINAIIKLCGEYRTNAGPIWAFVKNELKR